MIVVQILIVVFMLLSLIMLLINHLRMNKIEDLNIQLWMRVLKLTGEYDVDKK